MDNQQPQQQPALTLSDGQTIGPSHHKFTLKGMPSEHPLGQFWQAEDISTSSPTPVSLIIISPELTQHKELLNAFKKQIIQAKNLHHKHIAAIYGYFVHRSDFLFFSCEALDGLTLAALIKEKKTSKLKENRLRGLLLQIATATDIYIKKTQTTHGALAPDLIYINREGGVKLLPINPRLLLKETTFKLNPAFQYPAYQAPEAFHDNPLPATSDIYSMGCIAYAVLSGSAPFTLADDESLHVRKELKQPAKLSKTQWTSLQQALSTDAELRQSSATALIHSLFAEETNPEKGAPILNSATDSDNIQPNNASDPIQSNKAESNQNQSEKTLFKRLLQLLPQPSPLSMRILSGSTLFAIGVAVGFVASLYLGQQQQALMTKQMAAWQEQAEILKTISDEHIKDIKRLEEQLSAQSEFAPIPSSTQTNPAPDATSVYPREEAQLQDNFGVFQDSLTSGEFGPQMISLPAGQFQMGDLNNRGDDNEKPVQTILLARTFALSRLEITFEQYDHFATLTGRKLPNDEGWGRGLQPVVNVSWQDATAYVKWLAAETGQGYRLPSEAEWEYAARSGTASAFWWGNELTPGRAICDECGTLWDGKKPAPVGSLPANPWGLHDLNGNVDEWVQDCYVDTYAGLPKDGSARLLSSCPYRSMRGGSWFDIGRVIRSASRYRHPPETSRNTWGFRVALDLPE
ncbi:SUMF1/EgtB/PvdO family nonheme iron enzyme [Neptunomonas antarctica]|uniref:Formylglycine-generating enzyme, required for sulfatase activity, contains SUMF1/FGE domain n=1 Tax=Neptunomonas antarctica TaxID=619304 RepID=A0A1N7NLX5_9GAMM|nr:SUMF1/EgtB/PvdO family nonheme iron enzyme [Neptunomonas antarctica]SIS99374.1 Formylglycine-generating enzyme, required for sulfatase activity, contains SUMF1/FGE domain [Neptunomonas antarctica]